MRRLIFGFIISLALASSLYSQGIPLERFNDDINKFELEGWEVNQLIKESEENYLLRTEVELLYSLNTALSRENSILFLKASNLETTLLNKDTQIQFQIEVMDFKDKLLIDCKDIHKDGYNSIKNLEWALKKEKIKSKWYQWSSSAATVIILYGIFRELKR